MYNDPENGNYYCNYLNYTEYMCYTHECFSGRKKLLQDTGEGVMLCPAAAIIDIIYMIKYK